MVCGRPGDQAGDSPALGFVRVLVEYLPGYASELDPNEYGRSYLKANPLANYCTPDEEHLEEKVIFRRQ